MEVRATALDGVTTIESAPLVDELGRLSPVWGAAQIAESSGASSAMQLTLLQNPRAATLRGLFYAPPGESTVVLVRATRGAIFIVAVDVRAGSSTFGAHVAQRLDALANMSLRVMPGFAVGFLTLTDQCDVLMLSDRNYYQPSAWRLRYNDPALNIAWPMRARFISKADREAPLLAEL